MTGPPLGGKGTKDDTVRIERFIDRYSPEIARTLRDCRRRMHALFPRGVEQVYDNYNALVFAFGVTGRTSDRILSIAAYPRWVSLFFVEGVRLADPEGLLQGEGSRIRHVVLAAAGDLTRPAIRALIDQACSLQPALDNAAPLRTVVQSISAKQRPRRPEPPGKKG